LIHVSDRGFLLDCTAPYFLRIKLQTHLLISLVCIVKKRGFFLIS